MHWNHKPTVNSVAMKVPLAEWNMVTMPATMSWSVHKAPWQPNGQSFSTHPTHEIVNCLFSPINQRIEPQSMRVRPCHCSQSPNLNFESYAVWSLYFHGMASLWGFAPLKLRLEYFLWKCNTEKKSTVH